jgi:hypothetical protein
MRVRDPGKLRLSGGYCRERKAFAVTRVTLSWARAAPDAEQRPFSDRTIFLGII